MNTYIIGDLQGCYDSLQALLNKIQFNPQCDQLAFVGDLVNRGNKSLETLRFIYQLKNPIVTLGNHDLHLLALYFNQAYPGIPHTLSNILNAPDCDDLMHWLLHQPFMHLNIKDHYAIAHAGIPPQWTFEKAFDYAKEVENCLQKKPELFLKHMYGNYPDKWSDDLTGWDRMRYIVNAFTRMRFCTQQGQLDLENKTNQSNNPAFKPWFTWRSSNNTRLFFGHWASLEGQCDAQNIFALDTGCLWGGSLTTVQLEDNKIFSTPCVEH